MDEYELDDLPPNASIHAADEVKKKLEEIDPCEKLRSLCKKGEVDLLEEFLSKKEETGVDIDYVSGDGWTCLHEIITHGCQFVGKLHFTVFTTLIIFYKQRSDLATSLRFLVLLICVA